MVNFPAIFLASITCIIMLDSKGWILIPCYFNFRFISSPLSSSREEWTHSYVLSPCLTNEDCIPVEYHNVTVPPSLISCDFSTGLCECQRCFVRRNDVCEVNTNACNRYMPESGECSDDRKSQRTALLLSVFLSAAGAANFYIGQNLLGL